MIISFINHKGGTGKTTTATAIAHYAAKQGRKVLLIDFDPQGNASGTIGQRNNGMSNAFLLAKGKTVEPLTAGQIDIIPSSKDLATIGAGADQARAIAANVRKYAKLYDLILLDTSPTVGILQYGAILASDGIIIPARLDLYNAEAFTNVKSLADALKRPVIGYILTDTATRSKISKTIQGIIEAEAERLAIPSLGNVRKCVAMEEANALHKSIFEYAPRSNAAKDYETIYKQLEKIFEREDKRK